MCMCVCVVSHSVVSGSLQPHGLVTQQAPLSMGFSRQEYWSGLPFPYAGDLPDPGMKPESPVSPALQEDSLLLSHGGSPMIWNEGGQFFTVASPVSVSVSSEKIVFKGILSRRIYLGYVSRIILYLG